ncbi:MAG: flagellar basal body P-ring protein FlgI [Gemmatimonadales bacterium]|nr:flagellar basal body P-ring protein FlgI [Gemmatimonadales bacterium]
MAVRRLALAAVLLLGAAAPVPGQTIGDLTVREGEVPVRIVGYGLVVGLDGTGDRSFGSSVGSVQTVRSVTNLLRRFNIEVPPDRLRLRNVAAVLVTAEISAFLRPGAQFEVQVASIGDATSLRGGVLWMTPLMTGPNEAPVATAQGPIPIAVDDRSRFRSRGASSGRIADGGLLEMPLPVIAAATTPRLHLKSPDLTVAARIAEAIDSAVGAGTARVDDPGRVTLSPPATATDNLAVFMASLDTLSIRVPVAARIVIDARTGAVVAGGTVPLGNAVVSLQGITVRIGGPARTDTTAVAPGVLALGAGATVQDLAEGLRALGVGGSDVAAIFDGLRAAGAVTAAVQVR